MQLPTIEVWGQISLYSSIGITVLIIAITEFEWRYGSRVRNLYRKLKFPVFQLVRKFWTKIFRRGTKG